jgi:hypothetical protein
LKPEQGRRQSGATPLFFCARQLVVGYFEFWSGRDLLTPLGTLRAAEGGKSDVGETPTIYPVLRHCLRNGRGCRLRTLCYATEKGCHLYAGQILEKSEMAEELAIRKHGCEGLVPNLSPRGRNWRLRVRGHMARSGH